MRPLVPALLAALLALGGCAVNQTVKLYPGADRPADQLALLSLDPHVSVTRIDDVTQHPGDSGRVLAHSAAKRRETVSLLPGAHEVTSHFFVLCRRSDSMLLTFRAEAGKRYRLKAAFNEDFTRWSPSIVEDDGEPVDAEYPWMQAMCKVQVQPMYLPAR